MNPVIELDNVHKVYLSGALSVRALDGVSLRFDPGDSCAIMGPSGSGKSTLLNLLGCLDRPTSGMYRFEGLEVKAMSDDALSEVRLRRIGFVFQSFNLIPQLSALENIELPLFYLGQEADESRRRAHELAERVGLGGRLHHRPSELSGGQQQRVAIARALANDAPLLLADEPTGNLDSTTGTQIMDLLMDLNREGKTIILVTHEPDIAAYARRRLHMRDGRVDRIEEGR